jgi:hypothetical protein
MTQNEAAKTMRKELVIAVGICVKQPSDKLNNLIEEIPLECKVYVVSGEHTDSEVQCKSHDVDYTVIEDTVYGYDLVRNRRAIFDKFNASDANLLLYLDDDEHFSIEHSEFLKFLNSSRDVGMLAHQNMYKGRAIRCTGTNYHARLLKKGIFPLEGKVIERVGADFSKLNLATKIPHDFLSVGMEDFIWRANRWAREYAHGVNSTGMRPWISIVRRKLGVLMPFLRFIYHFIMKGGFLDGRAGFYISANYAVGEYLALLYQFEKDQQNCD